MSYDTHLKHRPLVLVLLLALALRLWGIGDRLPDPRLADDPMNDTAVDEGDRRATGYAWAMWRGGEGPVDLNPKTGDWPGLPFYLTLGAQLLHRAHESIEHRSAAAYADRVRSDASDLFLFARVLTALLGVATVALLFRLGRLVAGRWVGLLAAFFLAVLPFHVLSSQRVLDPNLLALLFVTWGTCALVRIDNSSGLRSSLFAGAMIGLAGACKYVPLALAAVLAYAPFDGAGGRSDRPDRARSRRLVQAACSLGAVVLAFAVASPFTLLDWSVKSRDLMLQREHLLGSWLGQSEYPIALPTYLARSLPRMMSWPLYLLAIFGCVLLARSGPRERRLVWVAVVLVLAHGLLGVAQERFILPAIGSLLVASAFAARWIQTRWTAWIRAARPRAVAPLRAAPVAALLLATAAWSGSSLAAVRGALAREDSRHAARAWIRRAIDPRKVAALDLYGPVLQSNRGPLTIPWPFLVTGADLVRPAYDPAWLDGIDHYVTSSEVWRRFRGSREAGAEAAFHVWIQRHAARLWSNDPERTSGPRIEVWALPESISTPEERAALWNEARRGRVGARLAQWCTDMATAFLLADRFERAEEWAQRGLSIPWPPTRQVNHETLAYARVRRGDLASAEAAARTGLEEFPQSPQLHLYRAMALETLGRGAEAIAEYRAALPLYAEEGPRSYIRAAIEKLEGPP